MAQNLTAQERITYTTVLAQQENYWKKFINQSFSGLNNLDSAYINNFDWLLLLLNGNADQKVVLTAVTLFDFCNNLTQTTCLEVLLKGQIPNEYYVHRDEMMAKLNVSDYTSGFKGIFSTLWHGKLPCYDTLETRPSRKHKRNFFLILKS